LTKNGTEKDKIAPCKKAITEWFSSVAFEIIGNVVSMEVAPPGARAVKKLMYFAKIGINMIAKTSLKIFVRKAIAAISEFAILFKITGASEYQPKPAEMAREAFGRTSVSKPATKPPKKVPDITATVRKSNILPFDLIS
jgi:hypothetical protein